MDLVRIVRNEVFTDSKIIADGTNVTHRKIKTVIRTHANDMGDFGGLSAPYRAESTGGRPEEYYRLNEQQATFLITLLKNTPTVTAFKKELVRQFFSMRALLAQKQTEVYKDTRAYQKAIRKQETDAIKALVDYAKGQGSRNAVRYYSSLSKLADKTVGIKDREQATIKQLSALSMVENIIDKAIVEGMSTQKYYRDIYKECKQRLEQFQAMTFIET